MIKFKEPKDTDNIRWTRHCKEKMRYYALSAATVKNVLWNPKRKETSIVEGTKAQMKPTGSRRRPQEIWIMYQSLKRGTVRMISAWRYPGITKPKDPIPIPSDILEKLREML